MMKVSESLPDIAVLRGGTHDFKKSLQEGAEVLTSLTKLGYEPVDVLIDREGAWTLHGAPTDPHAVFTKAHTIVDTTKMRDEPYQQLAKKMQVSLLFSDSDTVTLSREDLYRILRQQQIKVPDTFVVRANAPLKNEIFRDLWTRFHTPLLVRPLHKNAEVPSKIVRLFHDLENTIREYHQKGVDMHVLTYRKLHTTSVAVLPNFRRQKVYVPMWVDTFPENDGLPNKDSRMQSHQAHPSPAKITRLARSAI
jgi:D-alanine-D-alanine ligase-like ATP-grasp enzyme